MTLEHYGIPGQRHGVRNPEVTNKMPETDYQHLYYLMKSYMTRGQRKTFEKYSKISQKDLVAMRDRLKAIQDIEAAKATEMKNLQTKINLASSGVKLVQTAVTAVQKFKSQKKKSP